MAVTKLLARNVLLLASLQAVVACEEATTGDDDTVAEVELPACDAGQRHDPDLPEDFLDGFPDGCIPQSCGVGRWGNLDIDEHTVFVDAHAKGDGNGTEDAPFALIQDGLELAGAQEGGLVAVAAGTYVENPLLDRDNPGVHLAGRCLDLVVIDGSDGGPEDVALEADGYWGDEEWWVSGVTVTGGPYAGISLIDGYLHIEDAALDGNRRTGAFVASAASRMDLLRVDVLNTEIWIDPEVGEISRGINVQEYGTLYAEDCRVERNTDIGVFVDRGGSIYLVDVDVRNTQPRSDGENGLGISAQDGGKLWAKDCRVERNAEVGIVGLHGGTEIYLEGVDVLDTLPWSPEGIWGMGIYLGAGAALRADDCRVRGNAEAGIVASGEGTRVQMSNVEVADTAPLGDGTWGRGIHVEFGASLQAEHCQFEGNSEVGIFASKSGTEVTLADVDVRGTIPAAEDGGGWGIGLQEGAHLHAADCRVENNTGDGIIAVQEGTRAYLSRVEVRDTQQDTNGMFGRGLEVTTGAYLMAEDCLLERNVEQGVFVSGNDSSVYLSNVEVRQTHRGSFTTVAAGLLCQWGATIDASNVVVSETEGVGAIAFLDGELHCRGCSVSDSAFSGILVRGGGSLVLQDSTISGTIPDANEGGGVGIYASDWYGPATLVVDNTTIEDQPLSAVWLNGNGSYTVLDSELVGGYGLLREYPDGETVLLHGDGVLATAGVTSWDGSSGLRLQGNDIRDAYRAGILLDGASARLADNAVSGGSADLIWQDCEGIEEPSGLDSVGIVDYCPAYNHHMMPLEFDFYLDESVPLD